jgi:hypothetical protein
MGDLLSVKYDNRLSEGLLRVLFVYDLPNLEQMLEDVLNTQEWQGVVQVRRAAQHSTEQHSTAQRHLSGACLRQRVHAAMALLL